MANRRDLEALAGEIADVYVQVDNVWLLIPGTNTVNHVSGEKPVREATGFSGTKNRTGQAPVPAITIGLSSFLPQFPVMQAIHKAYVDDDTLSWRYSTPADAILPAQQGNALTAAISNLGVVTFAGAGFNAEMKTILGGAQVPKGAAMVIANKDYVIIDKTYSNLGELTAFNVVDAMTGLAPAAQVAAAAFSIRTPKVQWGPFLAKVLNSGNADMDSQTTGVTSQIIILPLAAVPYSKVVAA